VNVNTQVMVGCVDFSKYTNANGENEMYDKLKESIENEDIKMAFIVFDDDHYTAWICWCKEELM